MAEPTATADPVDTAENAIEDDLGELEAILAEVNADAEPSAGGSKQQTSAKAEADTAAAEGEQPAEAVTAEAPTGEAQDGPAPDPTAEESAELEMQYTGEQAGFGTGQDEPGSAMPDAEGSPASDPPKPGLAYAARPWSWLLLAGLAILDKPFANVSLKVKNILGYAAIATTITAVATWILAGFIRLQ